MGKTIDIIKEKRSVSEEVKGRIKSFNRLKKMILKSLETGGKTIPEIAKETNEETHVITYHLMTLIRYGSIVTGELDDNDEYYSYEFKQKQ
ncbi:MAG: hypothetical protein KKA07_14655 [Bacteroidetes bacterium]|nr:hypothetical protein [Bacteroidota bacterium]MBU1720301.1 hypothetical protein [Bacteroidota bacterium]